MFKDLSKLAQEIIVSLNGDFAGSLKFSEWNIGVTESKEQMERALKAKTGFNIVDTQNHDLASLVLNALVRKGCKKDKASTNGKYVYCYKA